MINNYYRTMNLSDYVRVYDGTMPQELCKYLIDKFEQEEKQHVMRENEIMNFTEVNVIESGWDMNLMYPLMQNAKQGYYEDCGIFDRIIKPEHNWEEVRMKRYRAGEGEEFRPHNDTWDLATSRRFLVYFWYLNDVEVGGETEFFRLERPLKVRPKAGRLIMFPSTWQYLHAGRPPKSNDKYIIGGYLHYN